MRAARSIYAFLYLIAVYTPIAVVVVFSFNDSIYVALPLKAFTLHWYEVAAANGELLDSLRNSLTVAVITSLCATTIGILSALAMTRYRFPGRAFIALALFAPLTLPTIVVGISLLSVFMLSGLGLSLASIVVGHILVCSPFAYGVMASRLEGLNPDYERASMDLGEPPVATFLRITLPLAAPGVISSLLLTFTISFDEFILAFFLASNSPTLPVYMWSQMRFPDRLPMVLALATCVLVVSAVLIMLSQALRASGRGNQIA